jgi:acyl-CoA reductase-like NAD-dependent aldehyde dehydrogenase
MAHYIGGDRQLPNGRDRIAVVNAATEEALGSIPAVNADDADEPYAPLARRLPGRRHRCPSVSVI